MDSLSAIDKLNQDSKYAYVLDRICLDLQHCDAKEKTIAQYEQRFSTAIAGLCGGKDLSIEPGSLRNLLSTAPLSIVQLACSAWIRASLACATFPVSPDIEREIVDAVDKSFSDVYRKLALDSKTQPYEKRQNLLNELETLERDMHSLLNSPVSVSLIGTLRQRFMKLFKTPIAQAVVWPFLPDQMRSEPLLAQLFQCVSEFAEAGPDDLMEAFENASEILEPFKAEAEQFATHYSQEILATLVKLLTQALADYMLSSPLAKPARIEILEVKKKYPLSSVGTNLRIAFLLKNYGPGTAQDVLFKIEEIGAITLHAEKTEWYLGTVGETAVDISVPITVNQSTSETAIRTSVTWKNFDHSDEVREFVFDLNQQRTDVDWEIKKYLDPYSLEPVEDESELVGRTDVLEELSSLAYAKSVGSCYLFGQKRVGKTSVVKTFR